MPPVSYIACVPIHSVAIGFVFEIDDILYELLPPHQRDAGLLKTVRCPAWEAPGARRLQSNYALLMLCLGLGLSIGALYYAWLPPSFGDDHFLSFVYFPVALICVLRAGLFAISTLHVHVRFARGCRGSAGSVRAGESGSPSATLDGHAASCQLVVRLALSVGITLGSGFFIYCVVYNWADSKLGFVYAPSLVARDVNSTWHVCGILQLADAARCHELSTDQSGGLIGLSYFADDEDLSTFTLFGQSFGDLVGVFSAWWQLDYAAYYR